MDKTLKNISDSDNKYAHVLHQNKLNSPQGSNHNDIGILGKLRYKHSLDIQMECSKSKETPFTWQSSSNERKTRPVEERKKEFNYFSPPTAIPQAKFNEIKNRAMLNSK